MLRAGHHSTMTSTAIICSVCNEPLEAHTEAYCDACGLPYHLNQRTDLPGKDCGDVWINEGEGNFRWLPNQQSGIFVRGAVREIALVNGPNTQTFIYLQNDDKPQCFRLNKP